MMTRSWRRAAEAAAEAAGNKTELMKHPAGIPICPESMGNKVETPCGYTYMPRKHGQ